MVWHVSSKLKFVVHKISCEALQEQRGSMQANAIHKPRNESLCFFVTKPNGKWGADRFLPWVTYHLPQFEYQGFAVDGW
jgi:hypothetical protein